MFRNIFEYYGLVIENDILDNKKIYCINKDVKIIKDTLPKNTILHFKNISNEIGDNCLPKTKYIKFDNYLHLFRKNTLPEGLLEIELLNYCLDINKCIFPASLEKITFINEYEHKIADEFFLQNPYIKKLSLNNILPNNINYNLYSTATCKVYINGILKEKKYNDYNTFAEILEMLEIDGKHNIDSEEYIKEKLFLINNIVFDKIK